jgi:hypothetical protein
MAADKFGLRSSQQIGIRSTPLSNPIRIPKGKGLRGEGTRISRSCMATMGESWSAGDSSVTVEKGVARPRTVSLSECAFLMEDLDLDTCAQPMSDPHTAVDCMQSAAEHDIENDETVDEKQCNARISAPLGPRAARRGTPSPSRDYMRAIVQETRARSDETGRHTNALS